MAVLLDAIEIGLGVTSLFINEGSGVLCEERDTSGTSRGSEALAMCNAFVILSSKVGGTTSELLENMLLVSTR